jgi:membrane protein
VRRALDRILRALQRAGGAYFGRDTCSQFAAAISFRVLFSIFPFLIMLVSILGLVLQDDQRREEVIDWIEGLVPLSEEANVDLGQTIDGLATPLSAAGFIALFVLLWSASGLAASLQTALNRIWQVDRGRPAARAKLVDFAIVGAGGILVLVSFGLTIVAEVVMDATSEAASDLGGLGGVLTAAGRATELLIPFAVTFATFLLLYVLIPVSRPRLRTVWAGALIAAVGFEVAKFGFAYYLANFARYNVIYGSLGAVIAFLFFVYLGASIFLFGAEFAAAWPGSAKPDEGPSVPLKHQVRGFVRGLFVRQDEEAERPSEKI